MITDNLLRIAALCVVLSGLETLNGIARAAVLVPLLGKKAALKLSLASGLLLASLACWLLVPPIGLRTTESLLGLGLILALYMAAFDIVMARALLRRPWRKIASDFNPATGNYLSFGLLYLLVLPWLVVRLQTVRLPWM